MNEMSELLEVKPSVAGKTGLIEEIRDLKKKHRAVILSHYYMMPELQHTLEHPEGVADFLGDSLGLSMEAVQAGGDYVVFCGVRFMAETAAVLNPGKKVLLPSADAGCSLAESITVAELKKLKAKHPGVPVIAYVNSYADVKAEADICCTSRNALRIIKSLPGNEFIFVPDKFMGRNLQAALSKDSDKKMIIWEGSCEVHEQFTLPAMQTLQECYPDAELLIHWEVPEDAAALLKTGSAGVIGSTGDIIRYVERSKAKRFIMASECELGAVLRATYPDRDFITPCLRCPHMKRITLQNTLDALRSIGTPDEEKYLIRLDPEVSKKARIPMERMLAFS